MREKTRNTQKITIHMRARSGHAWSSQSNVRSRSDEVESKARVSEKERSESERVSARATSEQHPSRRSCELARFLSRKGVYHHLSLVWPRVHAKSGLAGTKNSLCLVLLPLLKMLKLKRRLTPSLYPTGQTCAQQPVLPFCNDVGQTPKSSSCGQVTGELV